MQGLAEFESLSVAKVDGVRNVEYLIFEWEAAVAAEGKALSECVALQNGWPRCGAGVVRGDLRTA